MTDLDRLIQISSELTAKDIKSLLDQAILMKSGMQPDVTQKTESQVTGTEKRTRGKAPRPNCPHCASPQVVLDGIQHGKQRYWCKGCNASFVSSTNTIMSNSHYGREAWERLIADTFNGISIEESANKLGISHPTVFKMRHKILLALEYLEEESPTELKVIAELDETYVLESQKGKEFDATATREPRKRGSKASKRGLSDEQICICTGVERNKGDAYAITVNRAKPSNEELKEAFSGHIEDGTVLFTDGLKGYQVLEQTADCIVNGISVDKMRKSKTANLNNVNSFHSFIKDRYRDYRGVASKYINRYNALFAQGFRDREKTIQEVIDLVLTIRDEDIHMSDEDVVSKGLFTK